MSTTIDQKVVEMRFDNKHFETHTKESMSTLEKLKEKLNLTGASKGLENITTSANKVNMSGMANAIDSVHSKFSALEVMGVTALANITNSAVNAGKRMVKALTLDPVTDGFSEYEMTLNAIQTTMAATGKSAEEVQEELKKLDEYADKTVYSTADMLNNLPKFTNAGVELETATQAMIGIANATALAGGDASKASIAFYNLGQAIGTGYLTRMDYNSINNAGIATMKWKEQMVDAAIAAGTLVQVGEDQYQAGSKTLTLQQLFIDGLQEQWATTEVMLKVFGDYGDETTEIGKQSYAAAQDIKTFSMMMESLKATAGTGWKDTWQIIFGDLDEAKKFWTGLNNFISNIITKVADFRNDLLKGALTFNPFTSLMDKLKSSTFGKVVNNIDNLSKSLEYYQDMVTKVWRGDYKNQPFRKGLLEDEGHNFSVIQTLVNKGYQYQLTVEDVAEAEKKFGIVTEETTKSLEELSDIQLKEIGLTEEEIALYRELEEQSRRTGLSIDEIIESMEKRDGRALLIESLANAGSGLVGVFKALGEAWRNIFMPDDVSVLALKLYNLIDALNIFSENLRLTEEGSLKLNETGEKLRRTFEGIFAALDIVLTIVAGPLGIAFKILCQFLKALNPDVLGLTASIGDIIVAFRDWLDSILDFSGFFEKLIPYIYVGAEAFREWLQSLGRSKIIKDITDYILEATEAVKDWVANLGYITKDDVINFFKSLGDSIRSISSDDILTFFKSLGNTIREFFSKVNEHFNGAPGHILTGLINGLRNGIVKVKDVIVEIATTLINRFEEILGIASPSKVFFAIGGFIIAGLVGGLLSGDGKLGTAVNNIASKLTEFFGKIDWNKMFSLGITAGLALFTKNILGIFNNLTAPLGGVGDMLSGVGEVLSKSSKGVGKILKQTAKVVNSFAKVVKSFSKVLDGIAFEHQMEGVKTLAISILLLAGAIALLTLLDPKEMWNAVGVITALALVLIGLSWAMNKISEASVEIEKSEKGIGKLKSKKIGSTLLGIGLALLTMSAVVKNMGKLNPDEMKQGFIGLAGVITALSLLFLAYGSLIKGKGAQNMDKAGKMIRKMATSLILMVAIIKLSSMLKPEELAKGGAFVAGFLVFVAGLMAISMIPGKGIDKLGKTILAVSAALLLMIGVIKLASTLKPEELAKGALFAAGFLAFVAILVKITTIGKDSVVAKIGGLMLGLSAAMLMMVGVIALIGTMEWSTLGKGVLGITALGALMAGLIYMVKLVGPEAPKLAGTLLAMSVAIGILAAISIVLGLIDIRTLAKGITAVAILGAIMALMIHSTKGATDIKGTFIGMAVAIGIMAAAIAVLSFIDWQKLLPATVAVAALMGMFALIVRSTKDLTGSLGPLLAMSLAIAVMAGAMWVVAQMPIDQALGAAISLSVLMLALTGALAIISNLQKLTKDALLGVAGLVVLMLSLYLVIHILKTMQDISNASENALTLAVFIGAMAVVQLLCAAAGALYGATGGIAATGILGMVAVLLLLYTVVDVLREMSKVNDAVANLTALQNFMMTMTDLLIVLALVGPLALIGVTAMTGLTLLMGAIGLFAVKIGEYMKNNPALESFLDTGLSTLIKLAGGIGEMIGAFIGGALEQISASLPEIGNNLTLFMDKIGGFIEGARSIGADDSVSSGVRTLAEAILLLTAASFIHGITTLMSLGLGSFALLGLELSAFINNAKDFFDKAQEIKPESMAGIKTLAEAISILVSANLIECLNIFGGSSLETFSAQLGSLGEGIQSFISKVGEIDESQVNTARNAAEIIKILATASSEIPNSGGLLGQLVGENDMGMWANQLPNVARGISGFVKILADNGITSDAINTANTASEIVKTLAKASSEIPNSGGLLAGLIGDNDMSKFASQLPNVGRGIVGFIKSMTDGGVTTDGANVANTAASVIKTLALAANEIPNTGGLLAGLIGDNDLSTFASGLPQVGKGISGFVKSLGDFSEGEIDTVYAAVSAINSLSNLASVDLDEMCDELNDFGKKITTFATKIKEFVTTLNEVGSDSISLSVLKVKEIIDMAKSVIGIDFESLNTFGNSLKDFAKKGVNGFVEEFSGVVPKTKAKNAVKDMVQAGIDGAEDKKDSLINKFKDLASDSADELNSREILNDVEGAGKDFVQGFANGIKNNTYLATDAGSSIGKAALAAAKAAIDSNSPSKESMKLGNFFGQGFVIGIKDYGARVYDTSYAIAENAKNGLSNAISKISELVSNDIDTQPTIRPVLDLSDVESGAGYLSTMFSNGHSVGLMANLNSISAGMDARNQNGTTNDVISAIDKLGKSLSNASGDTYNLNGITYDDGSNIADAVKTLVRAAKVERRV